MRVCSWHRSCIRCHTVACGRLHRMNYRSNALTVNAATVKLLLSTPLHNRKVGALIWILIRPNTIISTPRPTWLPPVALVLQHSTCSWVTAACDNPPPGPKYEPLDTVRYFEVNQLISRAPVHPVRIVPHCVASSLFCLLGCINRVSAGICDLRY